MKRFRDWVWKKTHKKPPTVFDAYTYKTAFWFWGGLWIGLGAILGHVFTPFLGFKGGKGIAAGAGVLCGSFPVLFLIVLGSWVVVFSFTRIVSISSIASLIVLCISSALMGLKGTVIMLFVMISIFLIWTHRSNVARLLKGKEKSIG